MAFASEALSQTGLPRFQVPALPALSARRFAGKGLAFGLMAAASIAVLAVSLSVASVWTRAVSRHAPAGLQLGAPKAPLISALGDWHRTMVRSAVRSGPANGFGTAPDTEPQDIDLMPVAPQAPLVAPKPAAPSVVPAPPVHVPMPRRRPKIHVSELAPPPVVTPSAVAAPAPNIAATPPVAAAAPPVVAPPPPVVTAEAEPVPLPQARPHIAKFAADETTTGSIPLVAQTLTTEPKVKLASLPPPAEPDSPASAIDRRTAVYDIEAATVYMPNGRKLEAHSGLGHMMDDPSPQYIKTRMRGPTPPNVYVLTEREKLFHGVRAIRLTPVDEKKMYGRDGMLAHTYMLGPNGQSNGCVSFKNYDAFLQAFLDGEVKRMVVVPRLDAKTRQALSLPQPKFGGLFSAFAE
jgi:hypothetical protein